MVGTGEFMFEFRGGDVTISVILYVSYCTVTIEFTYAFKCGNTGQVESCRISEII